MMREFIVALTTALLDVVKSTRKQRSIDNISKLNTETNLKHYPNGRQLQK